MAERAIEWVNVDSSNIRRVAYHDETSILCVQFHNGGLYAYYDVNDDTYVSLVHADSVGQYLNRVVKVMHPYKKFNDEEELFSSFED